jgi:hypothetical protein
MSSIAHSAQKLARGCGWFALLMGTGVGYVIGLFSQQGALVDQTLAHKFITYFLFGHIPTFLVSLFILLRVGFQLSTDDDVRAEWTQGHQVLPLALACALVCLLAWAWFFLAVMFGFWLGLMQALSGFAQPVWNAYWLDFAWSNLSHAALRMTLLALALSVMTYVETSLLRNRPDQLAMLMSRFMTLGFAVIVAVELTDMLT